MQSSNDIAMTSSNTSNPSTGTGTVTDFTNEQYASLPCRSQDMSTRPWIRGVSFAPNGDFYVIDSSNSVVIQYCRGTSGKYQMESKSILPHRPRDITYVNTFWNCVPFVGLVITMETNKMAYLTTTLETWRVVHTQGDYSGLQCIPNTNLLVVINAMMSSVDVITIYGSPLYSYRMPQHLCKSHGYVTVTIINDKPIITVSAHTGLICMSMDWTGSGDACNKPKELVLKTVQRYVPPEGEDFKPEGVCAVGDQVLVADFAGSRVVKFKFLDSGQDGDKVNLYKIGEHSVQQPLAIDIVPVDDMSAQIGVARLKGQAPGFHLLKFIIVNLKDSSSKCSSRSFSFS